MIGQITSHHINVDRGDDNLQLMDAGQVALSGTLDLYYSKQASDENCSCLLIAWWND